MSRARAAHTVADVAAHLGFAFDGDGAATIRGVAHPSEAGPDDLALAMDPKYLGLLSKSAARAAMTPPDTDWRALDLDAVIFTPRARFAMAGVTAVFAEAIDAQPGRHPSAVIADNADIAEDASIGPLCVVEAGAEIGAGAVLLGQATVGAGARIGPGALIKHGVRIARGVVVGARAIVHENAVIGSDGFSFVTPEPGSVESAKATGEVADGAENRIWARIHSLAPVILGDDVEIGANAAIDRGTVAATRIGSGCKIDNHVQIGHNVVLGENCLLCGQVGVAGSSVLGDRVVLGGQTGVADQARIGSDVVAMAGSAIVGRVKPRSVVGGMPAIDRSELGRVLLATRRLPRLVADVAELKKRFS